MFDQKIVLEAMSTLCRADVMIERDWKTKYPGKPIPDDCRMSIQRFLDAVIEADKCGSNVHTIKVIVEVDGKTVSETITSSTCDGGSSIDIPPSSGSDIPRPDSDCRPGSGSDIPRPYPAEPSRFVKEFVLDNDFFDPPYDYDFTNVTDCKTYYRGGEEYERPCGWYRLALKVLNKYPDGNGWLGMRGRGTSSSQGEWPVSFHGTSQKGVEGIVSGNYQAGSGQKYGRGIYSTPYVKEALYYCKPFTSKVDGKKYKVMLQNRINKAIREKHYGGKYWLIPIPKGTSDEEERRIVEANIRPYGVLLKLV